jgi:hypothetical protein
VVLPIAIDPEQEAQFVKLMNQNFLTGLRSLAEKFRELNPGRAGKGAVIFQ